MSKFKDHHQLFEKFGNSPVYRLMDNSDITLDELFIHIEDKLIYNMSARITKSLLDGGFKKGEVP